MFQPSFGQQNLRTIKITWGDNQAISNEMHASQSSMLSERSRAHQCAWMGEQTANCDLYMQRNITCLKKEGNSDTHNMDGPGRHYAK